MSRPALWREELHIASLVVHAAPRRIESVATAVTALPGALVHASSANGKLVVTLEAPTAEEITARVSSIQRIDGVLSAALVYQCADSLDAMNEEIPHA
jgi:nitrate reductase NapD